jgi:Zn-dependent peptidase ImmA (M78 family)
MQYEQIAKSARSLQLEIWNSRASLWPLGQPKPIAMCEPRIAARVCGWEYELTDQMALAETKGYSTAGVLNRDRKTIRINTTFPYGVQRFTGAHEIGHLALHPNLGSGVIHRDRPVCSASQQQRSQFEVQADYFAACFLIPERLLVKAFNLRFGTKLPLPKTEAVLLSLRIFDQAPFFAAPRGNLIFANAVSNSTTFNGRKFASLKSEFNVSGAAMAIRLKELDLVTD